ncbi:unnamed protein product [Lymnaea stagnalis]|uniref:Uncharacterized protein n=1 Tax=Lymnaea stagnalis TaxID=6523 RepID=A0AAV2IHM0_LYMST
MDNSKLKGGFRYGVVSACNCDDDDGLYLDDDVNYIKRRLPLYRERKLPNILQNLSKVGFTRTRGARGCANKVVVLFTSQQGNLSPYIWSLANQNVKVYIADPSYSGVAVKGALTLSGQSIAQQAGHLIKHLCTQPLTCV